MCLARVIRLELTQLASPEPNFYEYRCKSKALTTSGIFLCYAFMRVKAG